MTVLSVLAVARRRLSGLNAIHVIGLECPRSVANSPAVRQSQTLTNPVSRTFSNPPIASRQPSGPKARQRTFCPGSGVQTGLLAAGSQTCTPVASANQATLLPSELSFGACINAY